MHLKSTLSTAALFILLPIFLNAQVTVLGKLSIGDSSHLQLLTTQRGDQFRGWIEAWDRDSITLLTASNERVSFATASVSTLTELIENEAESLATEIFEIKTKDGFIYHGYPTKINSHIMVFNASKVGNFRLKPSEIAYMKPETVTLVSERPYLNEYSYRGKVKRVKDGQLVGLANGKIIHKIPSGQSYELDIEKIQKYKIKYQSLPYRGYGRSLMFVQTGFGMKAGHKEFRSIMLGLNIASYGFTDRLSGAVGLYSIIPYFDLKYSYSFGKYIHASAGAYAFLPFSTGVHSAISIGTPEYFLNLGYLRNFEFKSFDIDDNFHSFNFGASIRAGRRSRVFAEYNLMVAPKNDYGDGYESFYDRGYGNTFTWGYGWHNPRSRFELG
ncbi:MAG: hypothetical protein IT258_03940, partial [Saprospiraceae bacterium]|nr:hypothetical protein [Saprospiraceae bacterium]